jgi:hypothetical protein
MKKEDSWVSCPGLYGAFSNRMLGSEALGEVDHFVRRNVKREVGGERIAAVEGRSWGNVG